MQVLVTTESRFHRGADHAVLARCPAEAYGYWASYLGVFDGVTVLARLAPPSADLPSTLAFPVEGPGVRVIPLPDHRGLTGYPLAARRLRAAVRDVVGLDGTPTGTWAARRTPTALVPRPRRSPDGWLLGASPGGWVPDGAGGCQGCPGCQAASARAAYRATARSATPTPATTRLATGYLATAYLATMPGMVGATLATELHRRGLPYALEVVGDPEEEVAAGLLGAWVGRPARRRQRRVCERAAAVSYVTREVLQQRYPAAPGALTTWYARCRLGPDDFTTGPRPVADRPPTPARLLTIGSQARMHKGHDVLLDAVELLRAFGHPVQVTIVGDGRHHDELVAAAQRKDLGDAVEFVPVLDRPGVRAALDACDLFVLPSRTEGLPRALIEAMARGVPAIGSAVGGVVELLAPQDLVPPGDADALSVRLAEVLASPATLAAMSARNHAAAAEYDGELLAARARDFYDRFAALVGPRPEPDRTGSRGTRTGRLAAT